MGDGTQGPSGSGKIAVSARERGGSFQGETCKKFRKKTEEKWGEKLISPKEKQMVVLEAVQHAPKKIMRCTASETESRAP